jgi:hypothetical protein
MDRSVGGVMSDKFLASEDDFIFNGNKVYKIEDRAVKELVDGKWKLVKQCETYAEAIKLLKELQNKKQ